MVTEISGSLILTAVISTLALTFMLFLYALGLRIAHLLHARDLRHIRATWWPILGLAAMTNGNRCPDELPKLWFVSRTKLLREWCRFRAQIRGNNHNTLNYLAEDLGLRMAASRLLHKRSISTKLLAIQALGFLRETTSWSDIELLLNHSNISISMTAATSLVHIDPARAVPLIIPLIGERENWPPTQIGKMLNLAGPDAVTGPLCSAIETAPAKQSIRLLRFYESAYMNDVDSLAAKLLISRTDPSLCAAALKSVRGQLPISLIERLAKHDTWFVRMQAASLLGRFGRREDYRILEPLLADREWWVRYRAAQAIVRLPFLGPNALRKLTNRQTDRYAAGILRQALAEAGLA